MSSSRAAKFSIPEARALINDLFHHRPAIYYTDFLISLVIGYSCASIYFEAEMFSTLQIACFLIGGFALFRVGSFIHEIVHFHANEMQSFRILWNLLAGVPMLMPSYLYGNHIDHHKTHHYGTGQDGEYLPLGSGPWQNLVYFFGQVFLLPLAVLMRFLVLTPLSLISPRMRDWTIKRMSSFVINLEYRRPNLRNSSGAFITFLEVACFLRSAAMVGFVLAGVVSVERWPKLYVFAMFVLGLNYIRNVVAHHYRSTGGTMSHEDQLLDSVNIRGGRFLGGPITELFFPLGLRYHALHHLFPSLPYHNLGKAHRRLMAKLPADSPYRDTVYASFWSVLAELWQDTKKAAQQSPSGADVWYARRAELVAECEGSTADRRSVIDAA